MEGMSMEVDVSSVASAEKSGWCRCFRIRHGRDSHSRAVDDWETSLQRAKLGDYSQILSGLIMSLLVGS